MHQERQQETSSAKLLVFNKAFAKQVNYVLDDHMSDYAFCSMLWLHCNLCTLSVLNLLGCAYMFTITCHTAAFNCSLPALFWTCMNEAQPIMPCMMTITLNEFFYAEGASSPMVGYANLAVGLLNLGMSGYNTYQLHSIKKLQKVTHGKVDHIDSKVSLLQTAFQATAGSVDKLHGKVDVLGSVLQDGISKLQLALQDHQILLHGVLAQCSALQQGQAALVSGQQLIMDEVLSLHADVRQGNAAILAVSLSLLSSHVRRSVLT